MKFLLSIKGEQPLVTIGRNKVFDSFIVKFYASYRKRLIYVLFKCCLWLYALCVCKITKMKS